MNEFLVLAQLLQSIIGNLKTLSQFIEANKNEAWFQDATQVFNRLKEAKTDDERAKLAGELRDLWKGL